MLLVHMVALTADPTSAYERCKRNLVSRALSPDCMLQVIVAGTLGAEFQKHGADLPRDVSIAMLVVRAQSLALH